MGGGTAIQAITESLTRKLLQDGKLSRFLAEINLQTLLDRQSFFLKTVFNEQGTEQELPENLREFYRKQTHSNMNDSCLDIALGHLKKTMTELDVPEHEIGKLMASLERKSNA
jgi:truncated hemoglobin YjbI